MIGAALAALLESQRGLSVVAMADRGDDVVPLAVAQRPDVAVLDQDLPGLDGPTAARMLYDAVPTCRTLILTSLRRAGILRRAEDDHVSGYVLKEAPPDQLTAAIRRVAAGQRVIDPQLASLAWSGGHSPLSAREHEVLRRLAEGADPGEIAQAMYLSVGTVRNYASAIVTKLNARNRVDAVRKAHNAGWLLSATRRPLTPGRHDLSGRAAPRQRE
jgi:two-component system response regulator DesR